LAKNDVSAYVLWRRSLVVYELQFSEAPSVLKAILADTRYRSHKMYFVGSWDQSQDKPRVRIEAEFAVNL
jgi:hypothetical protein